MVDLPHPETPQIMYTIGEFELFKSELFVEHVNVMITLVSS